MGGKGWCSLASPKGLTSETPPFSGRLYSAPRHCPLSVHLLPAGPLCPGAAMPPPSSSPPRRTRPWGRSSSMRWILAASTTSTKRSSACFPRCCFGQGSLGGHGADPMGSSVAMPVWHGNHSAVPLYPVVLGLAGQSLRLSRQSSGVPGCPEYLNANWLLFE